MSTSSWGLFYKANAIITIGDDSGAPIEGAAVLGSWSGAYSGDISGTTDSYGQVTLQSGKIKDKSEEGGAFIFTVTDVTKSGWIYDQNQNSETSDSIVYP